MTESSAEVTRLLVQAADGNRDAQESLFCVVEESLREIAARYLQKEPADAALQTTLLVDDAFVRLVVDGADQRWDNRRQFYWAAARAMRNLLVDCARRRKAEKRGGTMRRAVQDGLENLGESIDLRETLMVHEGLERLAVCDARAAQVVQLRYFAGRTVSETAEVLGVSPRTVRNDWAAARAFLHKELSDDVNDT